MAHLLFASHAARPVCRQLRQVVVAGRKTSGFAWERAPFGDGPKPVQVAGMRQVRVASVWAIIV
jgi:hypothetical protein